MTHAVGTLLNAWVWTVTVLIVLVGFPIMSVLFLLTAPFAHRIRLRAPVSAIERADDHVLVTVRGTDAMRFDHIVLATHSDQALSLLRDPSPREHEILSSIPYQANDAVLHTDVRLLPRRRRAWREAVAISAPGP